MLHMLEENEANSIKENRSHMQTQNIRMGAYIILFYFIHLPSILKIQYIPIEVKVSGLPLGKR